MTERSWFGSGLSDAARDSGSWKDHRPEPSRLSIGREVRLCPGGPSPITVLRSWQSHRMSHLAWLRAVSWILGHPGSLSWSPVERVESRNAGASTVLTPLGPFDE
jgi:hypothetical protein